MMDRKERYGCARHLLSPEDLDTPTIGRTHSIYREDFDLLSSVNSASSVEER